MKKISTSKQIWLNHRCIKILRHKRRRSKLNSKLKKKKRKTNNQTSSNGALYKDNRNNFNIILPENMNFEENYEETVESLNIFKDVIHQGRPFKSLRFDKIKHISPSAALVLVSAVDCWSQKIGKKLKAEIASWDPEINRLLNQMGYFDLLNIKKENIEVSDGNVTFLNFSKGCIDSGNGGEKAKQLRIKIEEMVEKKINRMFLFEGLSEAITNVVQHAYSQNKKSFGYILKQWWFSASFNKETKTLCVMFYDQGDGIPSTLPNASYFEKIKELFSTWTDSQKIQAAMLNGRSSTGNAERGKGLYNLIHFAKHYQYGKLTIVSNMGRYQRIFSNGSTEDEEILTNDFRNSIGGTLIEWSVKL